MLKRRSVTTLLAVVGALVAVPPLARPARAQRGEHAVVFVKDTADQLVAIANSAAPPTEKRRRLQQVIDATVDADEIARYCLGRFGHLATPEQQRDYLALFNELLVTSIAGHLGEYQGVRITMGLARAVEDTDVVVTMVERPNNPTYQVDWVVSTATGGPKIIDLLAGGTSLRLTQGSDFAAYLARHQYSIHELIEGMRLLVAQSG
jgi:phospholipid transport system substrate-binding protein